MYRFFKGCVVSPLERLPSGFVEVAPGESYFSTCPNTGGMIDCSLADGLFFCVFNRKDLGTVEGLLTLDEAVDAFLDRITTRSAAA